MIYTLFYQKVVSVKKEKKKTVLLHELWHYFANIMNILNALKQLNTNQLYPMGTALDIYIWHNTTDS